MYNERSISQSMEALPFRTYLYKPLYATYSTIYHNIR